MLRAMLTFDAATGTLVFSAGRCSLAGWGLSAEVDGARYRTGERGIVTRVVAPDPLEIAITLGGSGIVWNARFAEDERSGTVTVGTWLANTGSRPCALGKIRLLDAGGPVAVGTTSADIVCLHFHNRKPLRSVRFLSDPECPTESQVHVLLYNRAERAAMLLGFVTFHRTLTTITHAFDRGRGITGIEACADFAGWSLAPGERTETETLVVMGGDNPYALLAAMCVFNLSLHPQLGAGESSLLMAEELPIRGDFQGWRRS